ncbi:hypothetical protein PTI98_008199 [Pleurotus ostreatus]|nr:hypothetical protein PTI98_008199 [Pleurotus ostreatus]
MSTDAFQAIMDMDTYIQERFLLIWIQIFAYGVYFVLFGICIHLFRNPRRKPHPWVIIATVLLFFLSTVKLALDLASVVVAYTDDVSSIFDSSLDRAGVYIYVSASAVSDALLIYRCSIIWEARKSVLALPLLLAVTSALTGYTSQLSGSVFVILSMITNITVTSLIAGRIWWISRRLREFLGTTYTEYTAAMAIIIESGLLCTVSTAVFTATYNVQVARWAAYYFSSQAIGIAPTLILVRVGLGTGTYEETIKTLEFAKTRQSDP